MPGKPTDNLFIASLDSRFRQECLNEHWSWSLNEVTEMIEAWRFDYDAERPHSSTGYQSAAEYQALIPDEKETGLQSGLPLGAGRLKEPPNPFFSCKRPPKGG